MLTRRAHRHNHIAHFRIPSCHHGYSGIPFRSWPLQEWVVEEPIVTGDLIFTVSAIDIRRKGGDFEALVFDPENCVWTNPDGVEYGFYDGKFTAARVYWGMSRPFPYWWHFESDMNREQSQSESSK